MHGLRRSRRGRARGLAVRGPKHAAQPRDVGSRRCTILLCDEDRTHTEPLAFELVNLGHTVTVARSYADAFAAACAYDYDIILAAPFLRDRPSFGLPEALGIRRPGLVLLMPKIGERLAPAVATRVGFDGQLTKVVDAGCLDRLVRAHVRARGLANADGSEGSDETRALPPAEDLLAW